MSKQVEMSDKQYEDYLEYLTTAPNIQDRFETHFTKTSGCWLWTSGKNKQGYGVFQVKRNGEWVSTRANRIAYLIYNGPVSGVVRHTCDTPSCVNPEHLIIGSHKDNSMDMVQRDRHSKGEHRPQHKLTEQQVLEIRNTPNVYGSGRQLAEKFNVNPSLISYVRKGGWKHV